MTGAGGRAQGPPDAGHGEDGADADDRIGRGDAARRRRRRSPRRRRGRGFALSAPTKAKLVAWGSARGSGPTTPGSGWRAGRPAVFGVGSPPTTTWVSTAVVGDGQQPGARFPARAECFGDLRQRIAGTQHLTAHQVGGQVAIARGRTSRAARRRRRVLPWRARSRWRGPSPARGRIPPPKVYMQVSRSGQIRTPCIQASSPTLTIAVSSWSPVGRLPESANCAKPQQLLNTEQETGATDAADQNRDLHIDRD